jgi:hypothetical protein
MEGGEVSRVARAAFCMEGAKIRGVALERRVEKLVDGGEPPDSIG